MVKRLLSFICALVFALGAVLLNGAVEVRAITPGKETASGEQKVYSNATVNDEFADDSIMVVMSNAASMEFAEYSTADFSEIDCLSVEELSTVTTSDVKARWQEVQALATARNVSQESIKQAFGEYQRVFCIKLQDGSKQNVLDTIDELQKRDDVIYAGPDYIITANSTSPDDDYYEDQWAIDKISLDEAWDITTGSSTIRVGVIDSGIDADHPDLAGKVDVPYNRDFVTNATSGLLDDPCGHGTKVAGVIGAATDNEDGIAGVCWNVKMVSLRVLDAEGNGLSSNLARAIYYAISIDLPIVNISLGWPSWCEHYDYALETTFSGYTGLIVCSAGNADYCNDGMPFYPMNIDQDNIVVVGASTENDTKWTYWDEEEEEYYGSNYGQYSVDLFAPGVNIYMTIRGGSYNTDSGTSFAAPYVTGVAALMLSVNPNISAADLRAILMGSTDKIAALNNLCASGGRLNALRAVEYAQNFAVLNVGSSKAATIEEGDLHWYRTTISTTGTYRFYTVSSLNTYGVLYLWNGYTYTSLAEEDDGNGNFIIEVNLNAGNIVSLCVLTHGNNSSGNYVVCVVKLS